MSTTPHAPGPRALPARVVVRRSERGMALVLTFLVLMVLIVVLAQVRQQSEVELDHAANHVMQSSMAPMADACMQQAVSVLLLDLETTGEDGGAGSGGGVDAFGDALGGSSGSPLGDDAAEVTSKTDSQLDEWMNPASLQPSFGEDFTVYVEVVDEDSKINLLGLWAKDDEKRAFWRDVFTRLLDRVFEGTSQDFSSMDADEIISDLDDWVNGRRPADFPMPKRKLSQEQLDAQDNQLDTDIIENEERNFPYTLGELLFLDAIEPMHLYGFVEDDEFHPGLEEYLTVWSNLELQKPVEDEDDPFATSAFSSAQKDADEGQDELLAANEALTANSSNNGLINANTASYLVLRAVAPDEISTAFLQHVVEFRDKVHETRDKLQQELDGQSLFDQWNKPDPDEESSTGDGSGPDENLDEEDDPARFVFESPDEVISKVEEEFDITLGFAREEDQKAFTDYLGVTSQVFTIKVFLRDDLTGRRQSYRAAVWRAVTADGPRMIPLSPLEPYIDVRREKDLPEDLQDLNRDRFF